VTLQTCVPKNLSSYQTSLGGIRSGATAKWLGVPGLILVIMFNYLFKRFEGSHDSEPVPTLVQVIQASHQRDPHGCALPLVVNDPSLHQV
jgi:hypothetical protein